MAAVFVLGVVLRRVFLLIAVALFPGCVSTGGGSDPITAALVGRAVDYDHDWDGPMADHEVQTWMADGRTQIDNHYDIFTNDISGRWKVENGRYCEIFGTQSDWTCLRMTLTDGGLVRFKEYPRDLAEIIVPLFAEDRTGKFLPLAE